MYSVCCVISSIYRAILQTVRHDPPYRIPRTIKRDSTWGPGSFSKMARLSDVQRSFIIEKREAGYGYRAIKSAFESRFERTVNKKSVIKCVKKYVQTGSIANKKRAVTNFKFGTQEHKDFLDDCIKEKPYATAHELSDQIFERFDIRLSTSRICVLRQQLGWIQTGNKYCQLIRNENKVKRVDWCRQMIESQENFDVSIPIQCCLHLINLLNIITSYLKIQFNFFSFVLRPISANFINPVYIFSFYVQA